MTDTTKHPRDMTRAEFRAAIDRLKYDADRAVRRAEEQRFMAKMEADQRARLANGTAHPAEVRAAELRAKADAKRADIEAQCIANGIANGLSPEEARALAAKYVAREGGAE